MSEITREKQRLREKIWREMEKSGVAAFPLPCWGRIPNFVGAEAAADKLRQLEEWKRAKVVFVNPDSPQRKVRENALKDGKILIMASPRLKRGFILIDPAKVQGKEHFASTIKGAFQFGVETQDLPKPDLIVEGSVAVDLQGHRLGKGHGYGDVEIEILERRFGEIPVATTVHDMQVVENVPFEEKDKKVSLIVTPTRVIRSNIIAAENLEGG
jgi:5-formyltetrahydrofolate cyclo-ligase